MKIVLIGVPYFNGSESIWRGHVYVSDSNGVGVCRSGIHGSFGYCGHSTDMTCCAVSHFSIRC